MKVAAFKELGSDLWKDSFKTVKSGASSPV